jgi:hypothetical protein
VTIFVALPDGSNKLKDANILNSIGRPLSWQDEMVASASRVCRHWSRRSTTRRVPLKWVRRRRGIPRLDQRR